MKDSEKLKGVFSFHTSNVLKNENNQDLNYNYLEVPLDNVELSVTNDIKGLSEMIQDNETLLNTNKNFLEENKQLKKPISILNNNINKNYCWTHD